MCSIITTVTVTDNSFAPIELSGIFFFPPRQMFSSDPLFAFFLLKHGKVTNNILHRANKPCTFAIKLWGSTSLTWLKNICRSGNLQVVTLSLRDNLGYSGSPVKENEVVQWFWYFFVIP